MVHTKQRLLLKLTENELDYIHHIIHSRVNDSICFDMPNSKELHSIYKKLTDLTHKCKFE